ncbi:MAG: hypothetical protein A2534_03310 [Candidatus Magasanikbacteria bacterium RIFOXYD2_FULL_39_9]|uniref:Peptidase M14 domain-containing protein n=1 Tax=Candidatus Magasanikbacteria bacterium RIFOXYD1_FULL_40_23 TaxID=1798705 RepID=A0A1F6PAD2_9BACT|nr:MAG: hypothetical protein A2534_03310 [Candidatus Magasanikbacteria bacterium RIFOXYD2_FULL_39_9]OGH93116.1 MAG: hypothetical protein A2563_00315 [Candidatus Magasanikbacteria bacterium RIFOXYD1_FULL_40_23]
MKEKTGKITSYQDLIFGYRHTDHRLHTYGKVKEDDKKYTLYKIIANARYKKTLLITTGFHGEEFNAPIALLHTFDKIVTYAKKRRVRLIVYPCVNPSGFDLRQRYNASDEQPNNDFMRYVMENGEELGVLEKDEHFVHYNIVDSPAKEVKLLKKDILKYLLIPPDGMIDLHQQEGSLENGEIYAYVFDRTPLYRRIMRKLGKIAPIAKNDLCTSNEDRREVFYRINEDGLIVLHDGTITDLFYQKGSKFVVTSETKTTMPLEKVAAINLIWIKELINLIASK